jgi:hypothetical protein
VGIEGRVAFDELRGDDGDQQSGAQGGPPRQRRIEARQAAAETLVAFHRADQGPGDEGQAVMGIEGAIVEALWLRLLMTSVGAIANRLGQCSQYRNRNGAPRRTL